MCSVPGTYYKWKSKCIMRALEIVQRVKPQIIRTDNGPEFTSKEFEWWRNEQEIEIQFIQPGRPMQRVKSKGLTEFTAKPFSRLTSLPISEKFDPLQKNGWKNTTKYDPMKGYKNKHSTNANNKSYP